jgi:hypothetical protein
VKLAALWAVSAAVFVAWFMASDLPPTGDEPAYLQMAQSIVLDGDLDLRADERDAARAGAILPGADRLVVDGGDFRGDGRLRPVYPPGTALLVVPAVAVGRALDVSIVTVARAEMAAIAAVGSVLLWVLARRLSGGDARATWLAWAAAALTIPLLPFATQVYPDVPAMVAFVAALVALARPLSVRAALVVGTVAAILPWLQVRFFAIGAALVAAALVRWRWPRSRPVLAAVLAPVVVSWAGTAVYSHHVYGDWRPNAAYSLREPPPLLTTLWNEGLGNFLSASSGWFPFAPVAGLAVVACVAGVVCRRIGPAGGVVGTGLLLYAAAVGATSWAGGTMPARFLIVAVPAVVVGVAWLARLPGRWWPSVLDVLVAVSVAIGVGGAVAGDELIDDPGYTEAPGAAELAGLFPTFINDHADTKHGYVSGPDDPRTTGREAGGVVVAEEGTDGPGLLSFGPYSRLHPGRWRATYELAGEGEVCLDVTSDLGEVVLASRCVDGSLGTEVLEFETGRRADVETRVIWGGNGAVALRHIVVEHLEDLRPSRGWPYAVAWVAVLGVLVALLATYRRPA